MQPKKQPGRKKAPLRVQPGDQLCQAFVNQIIAYMGKGRSLGGGGQRKSCLADLPRRNRRIAADARRLPPVVGPAFFVHLGINVILAKQLVKLAPIFQQAAPWSLPHGVKGGESISDPAGFVYLPQMFPIGHFFGRAALSVQLVFQPEQLLVKAALPPAGKQLFQKRIILPIPMKQRHGAALPAFFQKTAKPLGLTAHRLLPDAGMSQLAQQKQKRTAKRLRQGRPFFFLQRLLLLPDGQRFLQLGKAQLSGGMGQKDPGKTGNPAFSARKGRQPDGTRRRAQRSRFLLQETAIITKLAGGRQSFFRPQAAQKSNVFFQPFQGGGRRQEPCPSAARSLTGQRLHPGGKRCFRRNVPPGKNRLFSSSEKKQKKQRKACRSDPPFHLSQTSLPLC